MCVCPSVAYCCWLASGALEALKKLLVGPLTRDVRDKHDEEVLMLVLTILRNLLHVPTSNHVRQCWLGEGRADPGWMFFWQERLGDGRASLHERCVLAFHEAGLLALLVHLCNHIESYDKAAVLLMEMTVLTLREQDPRAVLHAGSAAGAAQRVRAGVERLCVTN